MNFEEIKNFQNQWIWDNAIRIYFWIFKKGKTRSSYDMICKLANFFDTTTDYLLGNSNERYKNELKDIGCKNSVLIIELDKVGIKKNTI